MYVYRTSCQQPVSKLTALSLTLFMMTLKKNLVNCLKNQLRWLRSPCSNDYSETIITNILSKRMFFKHANYMH